MNYLVYKIGIKVLEIYLNLASFTGNEKAKKAKIGRRNWKKHLALYQLNKKTYWIHAASHGEAIMAMPIIEKILNEKNNQVTMSFFSASGFENFNTPKVNNDNIETHIRLILEQSSKTWDLYQLNYN